MQKYIVSVSKKNNSVWKIYFYDENENEDSLGKIVSSALIGLVAMKFRP